VKENIGQEVSRHKNLTGKNMQYSAAPPCSYLMQVDLIEEFRIMNPIILGKVILFSKEEMIDSMWNF